VQGIYHEQGCQTPAVRGGFCVCVCVGGGGGVGGGWLLAGEQTEQVAGGPAVHGSCPGQDICSVLSTILLSVAVTRG